MHTWDEGSTMSSLLLFKVVMGALLILQVAALSGAGKAGSYYSTLGIQPNASEKEIKRSYRKLAMKVCGDRCCVLSSVPL